MKKIILVYLLLTITYAAYSQELNYLQKISKEPEGIATIVFSRDGYQIFEYEYSRMEPDPYSGPGLYSIIHHTAVLKYKGSLYALYSNHMTPDKILSYPQTMASNTGDRFFISFITTQWLGPKGNPFTLYNAYILQKTGDKFVLFEICTQMGDCLDLSSLEWVITKESDSKPITSIALAYKECEELRSVCYSWNSHLFLPVNPESDFRVAIAYSTHALNIRKSPSLTGGKIGLLETEEEVAVLGVSEKKERIDEKEAYWYYIYSHRLQIRGWVFGGYLKFINSYNL